MKIKFAVFPMIALLFLAGCNKQETKRVTRETSAMAIKFNELVKAGKTTREQEKAYIDAVALVMYQVDRAVRGTKDADRTKQNAEIEAKTGINPEGPIELNMDSENEQKLLAIQAIVEKAAWEAHQPQEVLVEKMLKEVGQLATWLKDQSKK